MPCLYKLDHLIENRKIPSTSSASTTVEPKRQARSELTRTRLLEAALHEFAAHGFEVLEDEVMGKRGMSYFVVARKL